MDKAIQVENLTFSYCSGPIILQDVSFTLPQGEFLGLIGPNGGGKTTLIKIILGIIATSGKVRIFGLQPQLPQARKQIGYVPQHSSVPKDFPATVADVALMGIKQNSLWRRRRKQAYDKLVHLAQVFALQNILEYPIAEISGGQMRRVFLVRALLREPSLLILDEPLAGVDSSGHSLFFEFLQKLRCERPISILMTSHHVDALRANTDRLMCLNRKVHFCDSANLISGQLIRHTYECELETFYHNREYHIFKNSGCRKNNNGSPHADSNE